MSAESKKKRGISGLANAKSIPFRYGGSKCDYSIAPRPVSTSRYLSGSLAVNAFRLADALVGAGRIAPFDVPLPTKRKVEAAMARCTHPLLTGDE